MRITADFDKRILSLSGIIGDIKQGRAAAFRETADLIKSNIKAELYGPKTGVINTNAPRGRRSKPGQSLARDTGASEKLIDSEISSNTMAVGFKRNPKGFDYVVHHEERFRPTMELAIKKSLAEIERIFERNLTPK